MTSRSKCKLCHNKRKVYFEFDDGYVLKDCPKCVVDGKEIEVVEHIDYWKFKESAVEPS